MFRPPRPPPSLLGAALLLVACGGDSRPADAGAPLASTMRGPDAVLLRVPREGGRVSAAVYPRLDSTVWRSGEAAPALARVLDFDAEGGQLAALDTAGRPVRVDLRLGTARAASRAPLREAAAAGAIFYGLDSTGAVTRLTPAGGAWKVRLSPAPQALFPQRDGTLLAAGARGGTGVLWVLRPPAAGATDSVRVPGGARPVRLGASDRTQVDRVYFAGGDELLAVQARTLEPAAPVALGAPFVAAAASPSGDRLYVLTGRADELRVVDRYAGQVGATVRLPGPAREVRVDPLGRYLLVRPERGDSAWVVAAGTDRVVGAVGGAWRADLPAVLPDGAILTAAGGDVAVVDGETLRTRATVAGGAGDFWHLVLWNGFRPRAAGLDQPVRFGGATADEEESAPEITSDSADGIVPDATLPDTVIPAPAESTAMPTPRPSVPPPEPPDAPAAVATPVRFEAAGEVALVRPAAARPATPGAAPRQDGGGAPARGRAARGFTVQFAAAPTEREARRALTRLRAPDATLRVVPRTFDGRTVYRVVAGPFATRAAADRAGRSAAGAGNYWVYGGAP